ncbi:MAG: glycerophosphodiester phosphodiesterase [Ilumatobacter sp.]|nr:glycerophosphodiester phosphodiesterase [Ilumatobacter sp.]
MLVIGHRGASVAAHENTVAAFRLADEMGADGVELDVRLAPDHRLLVKHDALPRDAAALDVLPTLDAVLEACGEMLVNVEIKNTAGEPDHDPSGEVVALTVAALRRHGGTERWIISSFDWDTIQRCRRAAPDIATAFLVTEATADAIERTVAAGHRALHPWEPSLTGELVERCHAVGLAVNTWTCNDPVRISELAAIGVDGICTDVPDVALGALGRGPASVTAQWGRPA